MISLDLDSLSNFDAATSREWLETNGIGGYSTGTVSGAHSRRYHGLLVAAVKPPLERAVLLSKFEEALVIDGERFELSSNRYPGTVHPRGFEHMTGFRLNPFPVWTYEVAGVEIEKKLFMVNGENSTVVVWTARDRESDRRKLRLEVRPLLACRDHHRLRNDASDFAENFEVRDAVVAFEPSPDLPSLFLSHNADSVDWSGNWYRDFQYEIERERGFDHTEDLFQPCVLSFDLERTATVIASTHRQNIENVALLEDAERKRRARLIQTAGFKDEFFHDLVLASDQFIVNRGSGSTVIAGYHWFSDWGRDTMIAVNGLAIATGRHDITKSILAEFAKHLSQGMLPNRFPDVGEAPEYNTVDATLWFFEAARAYVEKTNDHEFVRSTLYEAFVEIIDWHIAGTRYGIRVDEDGLLSAGTKDVQLTWMDAKIGDWVVTPRTGKAVEIQALWYNALCVMTKFAESFGDASNCSRFREMSHAARESFNRLFWNKDLDCLFDVINRDEADPSIRPNQIFAVSLPYSMLDLDRAAKVVNKVEAELYTPLGLRSLARSDARYAGCYSGSPTERDAVYHQGTVWAWLIGPYVEAYAKVHGPDRVERLLDEITHAFKNHLSESMLGQISEIFDGDEPNSARGCAAQAWSVAELLRVSSANYKDKSISAGII